MREDIFIYVASCAQEGGVWLYRLDEACRLHQVSLERADRPMYLAREGNYLWAVLRAPEGYGGHSALCRFEIHQNHTLGMAELSGSTEGRVACHLYVENGEAFCVNYLSGSIKKFPDTIVTRSGSGPNAERQDSSHPHFIGAVPNSPLICVTDLGTDSIHFYDRGLTQQSVAHVPPGQGPRHLAFSPCGRWLYCVNELGSSVSVFEREANEWRHLHIYSALPDGFDKESTAAAIRVSRDGHYLYVSNRGHDSIAWFSAENGSLRLCGNVSCEGKSPRDFNLFDDALICANEESGDITVFKIVDGEPVYTGQKLPVASPLCVI